MNKVLLSLAAVVVSFAASAAQAGTLHFDSGSAKVRNVHMTKHQQHRRHKVWVPTHRSHGRLVKGHYAWR